MYRSNILKQYRKKDGNILLLIDSWKHKLVWGSSWYYSVGAGREREILLKDLGITQLELAKKTKPLYPNWKLGGRDSSDRYERQHTEIETCGKNIGVHKNKTQFVNKRSQDNIWYLEKDTRTAMAHIILAFANSWREVLDKVQYKVNGHCRTSSEKVVGH